LEVLTNLYFKILFTIFLLALGTLIVWLFLPETFYESIGNLLHIEFSTDSAVNVSSQKAKSLFCFLVGFGFLFSKVFAVIRTNAISFVIGVITIFIGIYMGILLNAIVFKRLHGVVVEVNVCNTLTMWVMLPVIVVLLILASSCLKYFFKGKNKSPHANSVQGG
jgi:hypothetical protein